MGHPKPARRNTLLLEVWRRCWVSILLFSTDFPRPLQLIPEGSTPIIEAASCLSVFSYCGPGVVPSTNIPGARGSTLEVFYEGSRRPLHQSLFCCVRVLPDWQMQSPIVVRCCTRFMGDFVPNLFKTGTIIKYLPLLCCTLNVTHSFNITLAKRPRDRRSRGDN